jgi:hypothetical protein
MSLIGTKQTQQNVCLVVRFRRRSGQDRRPDLIIFAASDPICDISAQFLL